MAKSTATRSTKAVRASVGTEQVPVICSECYEDFVFDASKQGDEIVCPICEHAADRPDDAQIARIVDLRANEKKNFIKVFVTFLVSMTGFVSWVAISDSAWFITQTPDNQNYLFWGPVAVWALAAMVMLPFLWSYEKDRWEAYF